jgi:hypothetical protein
MGGAEKANIVNPGPGQCGEDGNVEAGMYELTEVIAYQRFVVLSWDVSDWLA